MRKMLLAIAAAAIFAAPSAGMAQAPIVIKFSHVVAADTPKGKAAEKFKELGHSGRFTILTKHPLQPTDEESASNPASRSAKLRALEMI